MTDYGLIDLSCLPLRQLSLSSFYAITDYSIQTLLKKCENLRQVTLVDMPQVTESLIHKAISICQSDRDRRISLTLSDEQMNKRLKQRQNHLRCPANLTVNFDSHLCGKQLADSEPTDVQMILVILMSALILGMTLLTTVVVVLVPLSMLLMMAHDYLFETLFAQIDLTGLLCRVVAFLVDSLPALPTISSCDIVIFSETRAQVSGLVSSLSHRLLSLTAVR